MTANKGPLKFYVMIPSFIWFCVDMADDGLWEGRNM
jgi:hypothetical protein